MSAVPEFQQQANPCSTSNRRAPAAGNHPQAKRGATPILDSPAESAPDAARTGAEPNEVPSRRGAGNTPPGGSDRTTFDQGGDDSRRVADALLALHADTLDDIERMRIALENRLRSLTSAESWGKGVNPMLPEVTVLRGHLEQVQALEHGAALALKRAVRRHYLADWIKQTVGVGEKQAARLIAAIGDPAWNARDNRPRRGPAELWAYCGLHVLHPGHSAGDAQACTAGVDPSAGGHAGYGTHTPSAAGSHPAGHVCGDTHTPAVGGVAPKRQRGEKANWSSVAKMRAFLVAESCIKQRTSPYRTVYDDGRVKYADATHRRACPQCGPKGKPALPGSPLSDGHKHARAMRLVMKAILRDMWKEAAS